MNLKINKNFQSLIPKLATEEYKQLEKNLLDEGWRPNESILIWRGFVIDGHNRYALCKQHNIEFKVSSKEFSNEGEVKMWIITNQLGRRNLSKYDKSVLALKLEEGFKREAKQRMGGGVQISAQGDE